MATPDRVQEQTRATVEELGRSLRTLVRAGRSVADASANVIERELAMVVRISEALRDDIFSRELLEKARQEPVPARFREDMHRAVDLVVDVAAIAQLTAFRFIDSLADALVTPPSERSPVIGPKAATDLA